MSTFRELRKTAALLKIKDRSKMNKAQLEKAISRVIKSSKVVKSRSKRSRKPIVRSRKLGNKTLKKKNSRKLRSSQSKSRSFSSTVKRKQYINYKFRSEVLNDRIFFAHYIDTLKMLKIIVGDFEFNKYTTKKIENRVLKLIENEYSNKEINELSLLEVLLREIPEIYIREIPGERNVRIKLSELKNDYILKMKKQLRPGKTLSESEKLIGPDSDMVYWTCRAENIIKREYLNKIIINIKIKRDEIIRFLNSEIKDKIKVFSDEDINILINNLRIIKYTCQHGSTSVSPEH